MVSLTTLLVVEGLTTVSLDTTAMPALLLDIPTIDYPTAGLLLKVRSNLSIPI